MKEKKAQISEWRIAVVFPYASIEYFGHLYQLQELGLVNVYILLNEHEYNLAYTKRSTIFDFEDPKTIVEHYASTVPDIRFQFINTGCASDESAKLDFYIHRVKPDVLMSLYIKEKSCPLTSDALRAKPPQTTVTTYTYLPFLSFTKREIYDLGNPSVLTDAAQALVHDAKTPCLCYQRAFFDILNYQWLYNIFIELTKLCELNTMAQLDVLVDTYKQTVIDLERAEKAFNDSARHRYARLEEPGYWLQYQYQKARDKRDLLESRLKETVSKIIELYIDSALLEKNVSLGKGIYTQTTSKS